MYEQDVIITTKYGQMPSFVACPDGPGQASQHPAIIFYMDAPGIREELRNMTRRIAKHGYFAVLPDMYYRLGTLRFDVNRRDDAMFQCMRAAMNSLTNAMVMDDTAGILGFIDAQDIAAVAFRALTSEHAPDTDLVLTGPQALSYDDVAAIMTEATGRPVVHRSLSYEQLRDRLAEQIPAEFAAMLAGLDRAIAEGSEDRVTDAVPRLTGRPARTFRAFLEEKQCSS